MELDFMLWSRRRSCAGCTGSRFLGVIPKLPIEIVLGIGIMALGAGAFTAWITEKKKRKQEQTAQWHNKIKQEPDSSPVSGQIRKKENIKKDPETIREDRKTETSITGELLEQRKRGGQSGGNLW